MTPIAFLCVTSLAHSSEDEEKPAFYSQRRTVSTNLYADRSLFAHQPQAFTELPGRRSPYAWVGKAARPLRVHQKLAPAAATVLLLVALQRKTAVMWAFQLAL
jgi:hypothetical protein